MRVSRIRFTQDSRGLWYWQYLDEKLDILAESTKLTDNLEIAVAQAATVTGLKIELSYEKDSFGDVLSDMSPFRPGAIGIEVQLT